MSFKTKLSSTKFTEDSNFYFGLILAVTSSIFIGSSFIIKKIALIKLNHKGCLRAGSGGFGYLKEWIWWTGLLCMGIGEVSNFAAYTFTPATLVTPLGALSVLVSAVLSSIYLKEHLNLLGKLGCVLCILGSTIIVIHSPLVEFHDNSSTLILKLQQSTFILYVTFIVILVFLIVFHFGPKYGNSNIIWYIILCSAIGSLTVLSCKALGITIKDRLTSDNNDFSNLVPYSLAISVVICITVQMIYLNRALDLFNTSIVTAVYYVFFTSFVLVASNIFFKEWQQLSFRDVIGSLCGFLIIIIAVVMLNIFKNFDINYSDIKGIFRPKRELIAIEFNSNFNKRDII